MTKKQQILSLSYLPAKDIAAKLNTHPEYVRRILNKHNIPLAPLPMKRDAIKKLLFLPDQEIIKRVKATKSYVQAVRRAKEDDKNYFRHSKYYI